MPFEDNRKEKPGLRRKEGTLIMISYVVGNILESNAFALVNPVNCEGYMGKGIAYQFKLRYPEMNADYEKKCRSHQLRPGNLHTFLTDSKLIINFPTKDKWREKSRIEYISAGLDALVSLIEEKQIASIAIPPLGSGNGGLIWAEVKHLITQKLSCFKDNDDVSIIIYEPSKYYQAIPQKEPHLSVSALILMKIKFHLLPDSEHLNKVCLQKTAYFMTILSHSQYFRFVKGNYGPYDHDIEVVSKKIKEYKAYHNVNTEEAYNLLLKKLISQNTLQTIDYYSPFIEKAASFTNHFSKTESVEGAGTALFIIQQLHYATIEEIISGFINWSEDKARRFPPNAIVSAVNELERAGFIQETICGFQIAT